MSGNHREINVAIIGNPNSGKTTLFNLLTGLNYKTGNFPGVTVDKRTGSFIHDGQVFKLIDLPGTYSLHPNSPEEAVNLNFFIDTSSSDYPDFILYVADSTALSKQLLLFDQLKELGIPILLALNMTDSVKKLGIRIDTKALSKALETPIVQVSARTGEGIVTLRKQLLHLKAANTKQSTFSATYNTKDLESVIPIISELTGCNNDYLCLLAAEHIDYIHDSLLDITSKRDIKHRLDSIKFQSLTRQVDETMERFKRIEPIIDRYVTKSFNRLGLTEKMDAILTHRVIGPFIFLLVTFLIFQSVFSLATIPMDWINNGFINIKSYLNQVLPDTPVVHLFTDGLLSGINGVLVFVPQIAIMFFFIVLLEESGYMARVVYMFDGIMNYFGMNGRSLISLISSSACAIPAIMSTRTIKNRKQRLITIFVAPFMSCSARIPVYTMLLALLVPNVYIWNFISLPGLAFFGLYIVGAIFAFIVALILKFSLKTQEKGYLIISLPAYRIPHWKSVLGEVLSKVKSFIWSAGRIILFISMVLWIAANTSMPGRMSEVERELRAEAPSSIVSKSDFEAQLSSKKLEASFAGQFGKWIEPVIKPLGYDWKIGIALLTSFAAREVFVGTLATIYSVNDHTNDNLLTKMRQARNPDTQKPVFNLATSLSLLVFYILAMQCMSTLAVVRKETGGWKWPVIQFVVMTGLAYMLSWMIYRIFS